MLPLQLPFRMLPPFMLLLPPPPPLLLLLLLTQCAISAPTIEHIQMTSVANAGAPGKKALPIANTSTAAATANATVMCQLTPHAKGDPQCTTGAFVCCESQVAVVAARVFEWLLWLSTNEYVTNEYVTTEVSTHHCCHPDGSTMPACVSY
jgi:hypothetical protein